MVREAGQRTGDFRQVKSFAELKID